MFLGQVSTDDVQADGCAARYYHEVCQHHNVTSELHLIPLHQQRTFCVGTPGEPGLPNTGESPISWDLSRRTVGVCAMPGGAPAAGLGVWRPRSMPGGLWPAPSGTPAPPQPQRRRACAL